MFNTKLDLKEKMIIAAAGVILFIGCITICKTASDIGDTYFPRERFMSDDFWNWKPK